MNNEYYEVKGIKTSSEIKNTYEFAVENNYKYYRAISFSGKIYGWVNDKHVLANAVNSLAVEINGELWFENDKYIEPLPTPIEEVNEVVEEAEEIEEVKDTEETSNNELNNKIKELEDLNNKLNDEIVELNNKIKELETDNEELNNVIVAAKTNEQIDDKCKAIIDAFIFLVNAFKSL